MIEFTGWGCRADVGSSGRFRELPRLHSMKQEALLLVTALTISSVLACGAPRKPPAVAGNEDLPAHAVMVSYGLWSCERGYLLRNRVCVPEKEAANESRFEVFGGPPPVIDEEAPPSREERLSAMPGFAWDESDFPTRPIVEYPFSLDPANLSTVIGQPTSYVVPEGQTLYEAARHLGLGINQVALAFPDLDLLKPPVKPPANELDFPTWWVLPESDHQGLVINIPEMRIYYFVSPGAVVTYPVGLGRLDWRTPIERFRVIDKSVDPPWIIPASIQAEHVRERGDARTMIPGGDPDNPLGHYRLRLDLPLYGIHGTNIPWGIGMQVTHGCVRLYPEDIERLFEMVPRGTTGEFVYQPVKFGARGGEIYVEVLPDVYRTGFNYVAEAMRLLAAKGWSKAVDWDRLNSALEEQRATPTRISNGSSPLGPSHWRPIEARGAVPPAIPPS